MKPLGRASAALARYDARLLGVHNKEFFLGPLRTTEAVVSSRIEGTVATLDEVFKIQADAEDDNADAREVYRQEALEVFSYARAMKHAQKLIDDGLPICSRLFRNVHSRLLFFGRGADKTPGEFKSDQNYVVDKTKKKVLFIPIEPNLLPEGIAKLERFVNDEAIDSLLQSAIGHAEFEALHPFKDGNGRLGRMLITLNLWQKGAIQAPHFYVSSTIEKRKDEYIDRLREVSSENMWTEWVTFFLEVIEEQSNENIEIIDDIVELYNNMKDRFRDILSSQWSTVALDYVFEKPMFRNSSFTRRSDIPEQTAHRLSRQLLDAGLLTVIEPASGRRAALLAFSPLFEVVRA